MSEKISGEVSVFDIQRGSFIDGPGIRTVIFFKGCNLRCRWCHNPESQNFKPQVMVYENLCTHCGRCQSVCPTGFRECTACGKCAEVCGSGARKISGYFAKTETLYQTVLRDEPFFKASDGGVTFSGGECMLQLDALSELLKKCRSSNIHTAVDTAGNVPLESFLKIIPDTDLFLYDIKCMDNETHQKYVGAGNERILSNLAYLLQHQIPVWVRVPIIPSVNDTETEMRKIADFFARNGQPQRVELLPYHKMGEQKYPALGQPRAKYVFSVPTQEKMQTLQKYFK